MRIRSEYYQKIKQDKSQSIPKKNIFNGGSPRNCLPILSCRSFFCPHCSSDSSWNGIQSPTSFSRQAAHEDSGFQRNNIHLKILWPALPCALVQWPTPYVSMTRKHRNTRSLVGAILSHSTRGGKHSTAGERRKWQIGICRSPH